MADHGISDDQYEVLGEAGECSVYRCEHGCLHVQIGDLNLRIEDDRFAELAEAVAALGEAGEDAKILAGGQSLIPVLRLRLAFPTTLVDLSRVNRLTLAYRPTLAFLDAARRRHPPGRPLRILEAGAGTGTATQSASRQAQNARTKSRPGGNASRTRPPAGTTARNRAARTRHSSPSRAKVRESAVERSSRRKT